MRVRLIKAVLWFTLGLACTVVAFRLLKGLGAVTGLTDTTPWGLWISVKLCFVALGASGFVIAGVVYIFHMEKYHPIVRPAILTGLLFYSMFLVSLIFDIGLPWNIWRPMVFWQHHSALFEVAWCVMLYFNILILEFSPVVLERLPFKRLHRILKASTIPLVIAGIILSTLHQSSLGTLFLIMPFRFHPLYYTLMIPVFFFVSAIGLGLAGLILGSMLTSWLYNKGFQKELLSGLAKAASYVLGLYAIMKIAQLAVSGKLGYLFEWSLESNWFILELLLSAIIPAALFAIPRVRRSLGGMAAAAGITVVGVVINRFNISGLATVSTTESNYFPSWPEFALISGIFAGLALAYFFFVENFTIYEEPRGVTPEKYELPTVDPLTGVSLNWSFFSSARQYSLIFIVGAALAFALMPAEAFEGLRPETTPVGGARRVEALRSKSADEPLYAYAVFDSGNHKNPRDGAKVEMLLIDGDRKNKFVLFDHEEHKRQNGENESCVLCHHMNKPFDNATSCFECHRDMFLETDTFDHEYHRKKLESSGECAACHKDPAQPKNRETATPCADCHKTMRAANSLVKVAEQDQTGIAPGYMKAMHSLCIGCHKEKQVEKAELAPDLARCGACHQGMETSMLTVMEPYPRQAPPAG